MFVMDFNLFFFSESSKMKEKVSTYLRDFNFKGNSGVQGRDIRIKGSKPAKMDHTKPQGYSSEKGDMVPKPPEWFLRGIR